MKTQTSNPWLDQNGKLLPDEKIKSISKNWSVEIWEEFLKATVETDLSQKEVLTFDYESLCEEQTETTWGTPCRLPSVVQKEIQESVQMLKDRPYRVIRRHYWRDMTLRKIAELENLPASRIHKIKEGSLNKIKGLLEKSVNTPSYLIGGSEKFDLPASRDEEIKKAYRADLEGSYLK